MPEVIAVIVSAIVAAILTFILVKLLDRLRRRDAETEAQRIIEQAEREATQLANAKPSWKSRKWPSSRRPKASRNWANSARSCTSANACSTSARTPSSSRPSSCASRRRWSRATQRKLAERIEDTNRRNEELAKLLDLQRQTLHQLSGLSREEATRRLLEMLEQRAAARARALIIEARAAAWPRSSRQKSRDILLTRIQRYAAAHTAETTTSTVDIPSDEMKGRIIGREGRNIRAFEKATGVDVIIDDTPGVVIVSGFDTVRREVARMSLNKLIADGRIHPTRIEEIVGRDAERDGAAHPEARRGSGCRRPTCRGCIRRSFTCWAGCASAPATARTCCGTRSRWRSSPA